MEIWGRAVLAALLAFSHAAASSGPATSGSLYPSGAADAALGRALGSARQILDDIGASDEFRAAVRAAIGRHPVFHQEASRRAEARIRVRGERAALYPRLSASLQGDYVIARDFGPATDNVVESLQPDARLNAGLSASQLLFDGGASFARIKGARADDRSAEKSLQARVNELALSALSIYEDLLVHQAILLVADDFIRRHETLLADVKERDRLGAGTRADVMQATARLAAARARMAQIRESMRLAEIRYTEFFAAEPGRLQRPSLDSATVASREQAAELAAARHPEIGVAAARADRARADYRAAKAARFPELRAVVNGVKYDVLDGSNDYDVRAGVNLNYDFFNGGARGASIAAASEAARQESFGEDHMRREVEREAMIAFERRAASEERLRALADAAIAAAEARRLVFERFRAARGDLMDVLQAENDYFESALAFLAAVGDRDMAVYALMEHTGELLTNFSPEPVAAGLAR